MRRLLLLALSFELSALSFPLSASDFHATLLFGHAAYLQGHLEEAAKSYRYAAALEPNDIEAQLDLAVTLGELGRYDEAQPLLLKAGLIAPQDPVVLEERAWNSLERERFDEAHDLFRKALALSTTTAPSWGVYLGDGLAYDLDHERDEAQLRFKAAMLAEPVNAAPMFLLATMLEGQGEMEPALSWYRRALALDPQMREAEEGTSRVLKIRGEPEASWQFASHLLEADADDPVLRRLRDSLTSSLRKHAEDLFPARRLSWPLLEKAQPVPPGPEVRVALLADAKGFAAEVASFSFVCNTAFRVLDEKLGDVAQGKRLELWKVTFDRGTGLVSLVAPGSGDSYGTRNAVEIAPLEAGGDVVVKNLAAPAAPGRDLGDRELRGRLQVVPGSGGLHLTLATALEDYVRSALASAEPNPKYPEALKALALVLRTRARARAAGASLHPGAPYSHCDSAHCGLFLGISEEHTMAADAVAGTRGWDLGYQGAPIEALDHLACGGHTQSAEGFGRDAPYLSEVSDDATAAPGSPWALATYTEQEPGPKLLDLAAHPEGSSAVRWTRVLDADRLEERLHRMGLKGRLQDLRTGPRTSGGRLLELTAVGSRGSLVLKGDTDIGRALSPGSLRSTLFTMRVLRRRGRPALVVLWGAGTGHGLGFCRHGADGLAVGGSNMKEILAHYFPKAEVTAPKSKPAPKKAAPRPPGLPANKR